MLYWIILGAIVFLLFLFIKFRHFQHRFYIIVILLIIGFFYVTGAHIIEENNVDMGTFSGITQLSKIYLNWFVHFFDNTKSIVGNAINMDWKGNVTAG